MTMSSIKNLLKIPLKIKYYVSENSYGEVTYTDPVDNTCYAEYKINNIISFEGKETVSKITFYIDGTVPLSKNDVIIFEEETYHLKSLQKVRELDGTVVLLVAYG